MTCILHVYRAPNDKDFELYCHRNNHQLIVLLSCDFSYTKTTLRYLAGEYETLTHGLLNADQSL